MKVTFACGGDVFKLQQFRPTEPHNQEFQGSSHNAEYSIGLSDEVQIHKPNDYSFRRDKDSPKAITIAQIVPVLKQPEKPEAIQARLARCHGAAIEMIYPC